MSSVTEGEELHRVGRIFWCLRQRSCLSLRSVSSVRWRGWSMMDNSLFSILLSTTPLKVSWLQPMSESTFKCLEANLTLVTNRYTWETGGSVLSLSWPAWQQQRVSILAASSQSVKEDHFFQSNPYRYCTRKEVTKRVYWNANWTVMSYCDYNIVWVSVLHCLFFFKCTLLFGLKLSVYLFIFNAYTFVQSHNAF